MQYHISLFIIKLCLQRTVTLALQNHVRTLVFAARIQLLKVLNVSAERTTKDETVRPVSITCICLIISLVSQQVIF